MALVEELRCNICGLKVLSSAAKDHSSGNQHASLKRKITEQLEALQSRTYVDDSSVVSQWSGSA